MRDANALGMTFSNRPSGGHHVRVGTTLGRLKARRWCGLYARAGVGGVGTRGRVIDRDQLRKLEQTVIEGRRRDWGRGLRAMKQAPQGDEDFHWRSPRSMMTWDQAAGLKSL
jgi:hypothetical protein